MYSRFLILPKILRIMNKETLVAYISQHVLNFDVGINNCGPAVSVSPRCLCKHGGLRPHVQTGALSGPPLGLSIDGILIRQRSKYTSRRWVDQT